MFRKRLTAFVAALLSVFVLSVPCFADTLINANLTFNGYYYDSAGWHLATKNVSSGSVNTMFDISANSASRVALSYVGVGGLSNTSSFNNGVGTFGIYLSFFYYSRGYAGQQNKVPLAKNFGVLSGWTDGSSKYEYNVSLRGYDPPGGLPTYADKSLNGVSLSGRASGTEGLPLWSINFFNGAAGAPNSLTWTFDALNSSGFPAKDAGAYISSFRVVRQDSSADLDALEGIADAITEQNEMLAGYYGDIIAICNAINSKVNDLNETQKIANQLLSQVVSSLSTVHGDLVAINQALSTYFELVIKTIESESTDIQQAIADAELRLETYLKPLIDYINELQETTGESSATLPGHKTELNKFDNKGFGIDSDGQTGLAGLMPIFSAFGWIFEIIALFIGVGLVHIFVKKGIGS